MRIKKAVFTWKRGETDPVEFNNLNRIDVVFENANSNPVLLIDLGNIKIEDRSLPIDVKEVLYKLGQIDFEQKKFEKEEFSGEYWKLIINEMEFEGLLTEPTFVNKVRKVIRFNAIELYVNKKVAGYLRA